jgi:hypothetical protein
MKEFHISATSKLRFKCFILAFQVQLKRLCFYCQNSLKWFDNHIDLEIVLKDLNPDLFTFHAI